MRAFLAFTVIMMYALVPVKTASADNTDDAYLQSLHTHGLYNANGDKDLIDVGHQMCAYLQAGHTEEQLFQYLLPAAVHLTPEGLRFFITTARSYYCPVGATV